MFDITVKQPRMNRHALLDINLSYPLSMFPLIEEEYETTITTKREKKQKHSEKASALLALSCVRIFYFCGLSRKLSMTLSVKLLLFFKIYSAENMLAGASFMSMRLRTV